MEEIYAARPVQVAPAALWTDHWCDAPDCTICRHYEEL